MMNYAMAHGQRSCENLCVMGFGKAAHGSSVATLSVSDAGANARNVPTYDWPIAPLPETRYPYAANEQANIAEEERCLAEAAQMIKARRDAGNEVAAMIVEPISGLEMR